MQNHTAELTRSLDRLGVNQIVLTTRPPGSPAEERLATGARVVRVGAPVRHLRQGYGMYAALRAPSLAAGADLIHAHQGEDLAVLPVAASLAAAYDLPLVVTVHASLRHTLRVSGPRSLALKVVGTAVEAWGKRRAGHVIALTSRMAGRLCRDGLPPDRVHVIPSGVDPALFAAAGPDPVVAGLPRPRVVYVGRVHPGKGVLRLVEAMALIRTAETAAHLAIVGDGPARPRVEQAVRGYGLTDRVHLLGAVPHDRVPDVLAAADVLVLPSFYEELGSVLLEAMQAALPIVATRVGGIPTVVEDGVNGLLVPPDDPASLASAIGRLLTDPWLARRMAASGRARAAEFAWPALAERVFDVYQRTLGRHETGTRALAADAASERV
ncbi:MAG: glycosyltransferase [Streptosporangiales bacterium]|nr:glycosyltransferase [Streptosporangiales bacterium]